MLRTRFTEKPGIDHPIGQRATMWVDRADPVDAVANRVLDLVTAPTEPTPRELADGTARTRVVADESVGERA